MSNWGITPQRPPEPKGGLDDVAISFTVGRAYGPCTHPFVEDWPYVTKEAVGITAGYGQPIPGAHFPSLENRLSKLRRGDALLVTSAGTPWFGEVVADHQKEYPTTVMARANVSPGYALNADELHEIPSSWLVGYSRHMMLAAGVALHYVTIKRVYAYDAPEWVPALLDRFCVRTEHWAAHGHLLAKSLDPVNRQWTFVIGPVPGDYKEADGRRAYASASDEPPDRRRIRRRAIGL
jgi:hypothetical protein